MQHDAEGYPIFPDKFPTDHGLIVEAESLGSGADIHDRNKWVGEYQYRIKVYNESDNEGTNRPRRYFAAIDAERMLRGIVAEARARRFRGSQL